jgi:xanthine dehydrogenase FAD-binding subunit
MIPNDLNHLLQELAERTEPALLLAGGTDIIVQRKKGVLPQRDVFCITHLPELKRIGTVDGMIRIGAGVTFTELLESGTVQAGCPFLTNALKGFASPLIRSLATLGGNIANASPTADSIPPLLVLDAVLELLSASETRLIPLHEFYHGYKVTSLRPDEILRAIRIPDVRDWPGKWYYRKVGGRNALAIAKLSIGAYFRVENGQIAEIRVAAGALNEYPRRLSGLETMLLGREPETVTLEEIDEALVSEITPLDDLRSTSIYRGTVCGNLIGEMLRL